MNDISKNESNDNEIRGHTHGINGEIDPEREARTERFILGDTGTHVEVERKDNGVFLRLVQNGGWLGSGRTGMICGRGVERDFYADGNTIDGFCRFSQAVIEEHSGEKGEYDADAVCRSFRTLCSVLRADNTSRLDRARRFRAPGVERVVTEEHIELTIGDRDVNPANGEAWFSIRLMKSDGREGTLVIKDDEAFVASGADIFRLQYLAAFDEWIDLDELAWFDLTHDLLAADDLPMPTEVVA